MKRSNALWVSASLLCLACNSTGSDGASATASTSAAPKASSASASSAPASGAPASSVAPASSASAAAAAPAAVSFFTGAVGSGVKQKPLASSALEAPQGGSRLFFTPVDGWQGSSLPGGKYMASKGDLTFRVHEQGPAVDCKTLTTPASMAPSKVKDLKELTAPTIMKAGKNGFVASVGACEGTGPKGPTEVHYADIAMKETDGTEWHGVLLVMFPKDASPELREEAAAWGRAAEYKGPNARTL